MDPLMILSLAIGFVGIALTLLSVVLARATRENGRQTRELIERMHKDTQQLIQEGIRITRELIQSLHRDTLAVLEKMGQTLAAMETRSEERHKQLLERRDAFS